MALTKKDLGGRVGDPRRGEGICAGSVRACGAVGQSSVEVPRGSGRRGSRRSEARDKMMTSFATEEDLAEMEASVTYMIEMARARRTQERYEGIVKEFKMFSRWIGLKGEALPAEAKTVERFVGWLEMSGSPGGFPEAVAALGAWHKDRGYVSPTENHRVRYAMKGAARIWAQSKPEGRRRDAFPMAALKDWVRAKPSKVSQLRWRRDAAMVALGMRLMLRPSELVGLRRRHVRFDERGWMWVKIVKRKNDQLGQRGEDPVEPVPGSPS